MFIVIIVISLFQFNALNWNKIVNWNCMKEHIWFQLAAFSVIVLFWLYGLLDNATLTILCLSASFLKKSKCYETVSNLTHQFFL